MCRTFPQNAAQNVLIGDSQVSLLTMYGYVPNPYQINILNSKNFFKIADSFVFLILITLRHQLSPHDLLILSPFPSCQ